MNKILGYACMFIIHTIAVFQMLWIEYASPFLNVKKWNMMMVMIMSKCTFNTLYFSLGPHR